MSWRIAHRSSGSHYRIALESVPPVSCRGARRIAGPAPFRSRLGPSGSFDARVPAPLTLLADGLVSSFQSSKESFQFRRLLCRVSLGDRVVERLPAVPERLRAVALSVVMLRQYPVGLHLRVGVTSEGLPRPFQRGPGVGRGALVVSHQEVDVGPPDPVGPGVPGPDHVGKAPDGGDIVREFRADVSPVRGLGLEVVPVVAFFYLTGRPVRPVAPGWRGPGLPFALHSRGPGYVLPTERLVPAGPITPARPRSASTVRPASCHPRCRWLPGRRSSRWGAAPRLPRRWSPV